MTAVPVLRRKLGAGSRAANRRGAALARHVLGSASPKSEYQDTISDRSPS